MQLQLECIAIAIHMQVAVLSSYIYIAIQLAGIAIHSDICI